MTIYGDDYVISIPAGPIPGLFRDSSAGTTTDDEFIDHNVKVNSPETYYILVTGANQGNSYTLTGTELTGADDSFEQNDVSTDAKAIIENDVAFGSQSDEDWYSIEVLSGYRHVLASLRFYNTELADTIDLNLDLFDSNGISIASSANASGINESIDVVVPAAGTYHVRVSGDNNADGYALDWAGVNEAPQAVANTVNTTENIPYNFVASDFTFSDSEDDSLVSATLDNQALGGGTLTHSSGTPVIDTDTLTAAQLDTLVYTPPADTTASPLATFSFTVNDADAGTVSAQLSINVTADVTAPVITLTGSQTVSVELGTAYVDDGASAQDNVDGDISANITATSTVDVNTVGTYSVTYNVSDAAGNAATPVIRTVNVTATTATDTATTATDTGSSSGAFAPAGLLVLLLTGLLRRKRR
jgi:MYXO-CTERM domain-containing protein